MDLWTVERLKDQLVMHEGIKLKPYRCTSGKLTIGVGRNLDDNGISDMEAYHLLKNDIEGVINDLDRHCAWWVTLSEERQLVLADMCFNLGIVKLLQFKRTLNAIQKGLYGHAARYMLESKWAKQVGKRAKKLSKMMEEG